MLDLLYTFTIYILLPLLGLCYIIRKLISSQFGHVKPEDEVPVRGKIVLLTGANTGIGKAVAEEFAKRSATVIMACRNLDSCKKAIVDIRNVTFNGTLIPMKLDLDSLESVRGFAKEFQSKYDKIDLMIANAGVLMERTDEKTKDGFEKHMGVNYLGHFLLINLLMDQIKNSGDGRVVLVSSIALKMGQIDFNNLMSVDWPVKTYPPEEVNPLYSNSKLAMAWFSKELSSRLQGTGIHTYCLCPGIVTTEIGRDIIKSINGFQKAMFYIFSMLIAKTPAQGAATVLYCSLSKTIAHETGKLYRHCARWKDNYIFPEDAHIKAKIPFISDEDCLRLWEMSEKLVGLKP